MKHLPIKTLIASLIFLITWTLFGLSYWLLSTLFFKHPAGESLTNGVLLITLVLSAFLAFIGFTEMVEDQQRARK